MFGSNVAALANSPFLRRSGSRPIVSELGEPGLALDENPMIPTETSEMKAGNSLVHGAAIMPSPTFLWRFKCATWMTIIVPTSMTAYLYLYSHGAVSLAASQPVNIYPFS